MNSRPPSARLYEGEAAANSLRLAGIVAFYLIELWNVHGASLGTFGLPKHRDPRVHRVLTFSAAAWVLLVLAVRLCIRQRAFARALKWVATSLDLVLMTLVLVVVDDPRSPAVTGYFVILALAALRFDARLSRYATFGAVIGYGVLIEYVAWYSGNLAASAPRYQQIMMVASLILTGSVLTEIARRTRVLIDTVVALQSSGREP